MATVSLFQERQNLGGGLGYRIINQVTAATDIPQELFVFYASDDMYSHVATLQDFVYPPVKTSGYSFYRASSSQKDFKDVETALEFANHTKYRINELLKYYNEDFATFVGTETTNLPLPTV